MIKIIHYRKKCIGCNACVETDPKRWRVSWKDGQSILIGAEEKNGIYQLDIDEEDYKIALKTIKNCPVGIIKLEKSQQQNIFNEENRIIHQQQAL